MSLRLILLAAISVLMLLVCVVLELSGSAGPRPGFVGVCGAAGLLTVVELASLGQRLRRLEAAIRDQQVDGSNRSPEV